MITVQHFGAIASLCMVIMVIPGIDTILTILLIFMVIVISFVMTLFFNWQPLRRALFRELLSEFYLNLYKNDDFVDFLAARRKVRNKKVEHVETI